MATLTVTVIAFNEEANLSDCLESVKWADEIVVVDSFSTDKTVEIARRYTDKVIQREWPGHVEQKNFALAQATKDWVLCIDADERVSPELAEEIRDVLSHPERAEAGYSVPRKTFHLGRWITHGGWYPSRKLRLVRRGRAVWKGVNPHDHLYVDGPVGEFKGDLYHYSYKDISDHLRRIDSYTTISARELHARGKGYALPHMLMNPPARFLRMYLLRLGFLDGMAGFILAALAAYYVFLKYAKLWEMRRGGRAAP
jgi:glycosyltransferase involved in cell wall biosynthesis